MASSALAPRAYPKELSMTITRTASPVSESTERSPHLRGRRGLKMALLIGIVVLVLAGLAGWLFVNGTSHSAQPASVGASEPLSPYAEGGVCTASRFLQRRRSLPTRTPRAAVLPRASPRSGDGHCRPVRRGRECLPRAGAGSRHHAVRHQPVRATPGSTFSGRPRRSPRISSSAVACPSGLRSTPRKRVRV